MTPLRVAACQINPVVGDLDANVARITAAARDAAERGAQVAVFGEMALTGYPVEDLLLRRSFAVDSREAVHELARSLDTAGCGDLIVIVGFLDRDPDAPETSTDPTGGARNAAGVLHGGELVARYDKHFLPNYGVFDEKRWFTPGDRLVVLDVDGVRLGLAICEDVWWPDGPVAGLGELGVDAVLCLNASPFEVGKPAQRREILAARVAEGGAPVLYVNLVGGQDELVFDGDSFTARSGSDWAPGPQFVEATTFTDVPALGRDRAETVAGWSVESVRLAARPASALQSAAPRVADLDETAQIWAALVTGTRDYVHKVGGRTVALGMSGGIDSALVAVIAADAVGADNVYGVGMPSKYSSDHSKDDAAEQARRMGIHFRFEPIEHMVEAFVGQLHLTGLAEENIQARCRGMTLMSLSNLDGHLVLATGNKSELAVGYSTIYGDAVGAYAPIRDVEKSLVWELARWRNKVAVERGETPPIPENSITKEPSAELRPGQKDSDSLPDYDVLDDILRRYVEQDQGVAEIAEAGYEPDLIRKVARLVDRAEYKRRQYPLGPKVTPKAFGRDRRMPITNRWHDPA
ncbi:NAD+ synthetase [Tsukamurella pulmonis]|uniref:Glutamine-dependent NAD(+) synthetase n=1 Tax=Tsukamurella pulmonis TaxID=47312 RepID=A0A1H1G2Y7_9ACTN|nr:NAD+ synthase [Tsukamurella pulmonis]KXO87798.1 NAD+ synthetase [Tsukamurella pulmonis]KXP13596.1 NAD+ synthetase [Tsukamurella pulmonis]RDH10067.1 NAD+ synthase [Tsukamurella pulmonis]SDR07439.1 NAD+ synthase (glutamine-hydrolysing) [Tsukamurella pulmonis]SUP17997.1 Glutamine-dependent NAD(+) synthetase [Tsukamurella pulmonis]